MARKYRRISITEIPRPSMGRRILEAQDGTTALVDASFLIDGVSRDPYNQAARLGEQWIRLNRSTLQRLRVEADLQAKPNAVTLQIRTGSSVGAVPLRSPTTGKTDHGLVVHPRFGWLGIGPMMAATGWKVVPQLLKLPAVEGTERKVPSWVLASTLLLRLQALLKQLDRRFELVEEDLHAPRGSVNWQRYVQNMGSGRFLHVPSRFSDLREDRQLKGAIKFALQRIRTELEGESAGNPVVLQLLTLCADLLRPLRGIQALNALPRRITGAGRIAAGIRGSRPALSNAVLDEGLEAIVWTIEERGLAGLVETQGLPWHMAMEEFFEAWVETAVHKLAREIGGRVRSGRKRETLRPLAWDPPYSGSLRYLLPDIVLERGDEVFVFDAKYKTHWEELSFDSWHSIEDQIRERHRADLHQVLAYAGAYDSPKLTACLVYPCRPETWKSLQKRKRISHRATVRAGARNINVVLTAVPMGEPVASLGTALFT